ncbi:hypothetical protein EST38_g9969 [Candolleomyces aberdarensis]|uniref:RNA helicase n=1 Tax=Candolleomyces aberdarensis TaxID=2316362 RepID=A0A4Q2D995_9AGAR|nr:hypothetical protein EST38_g9969 [Candolleomyces aberdarensis]
MQVGSAGKWHLPNANPADSARSQMGRSDPAGNHYFRRRRQVFLRRLTEGFSLSMSTSTTTKPQLSAKRLALKRKLKGGSSAPRKKLKVTKSNIDDLPWKTISRPAETGLGGDDGILELEEVEGVEVVYEETEKGRVPKFKVVEEESKPQTDDEEEEMEDAAEEAPESDQEEEENSGSDSEAGDDTSAFDFEKLLPEWQSFALNHRLGNALQAKSFSTPTPIQAAALPPALKGKDVIGVAQTGSGKTLAYGLPIIHYLLNQKRPSKKRRPLRGLILTPTRELALQVTSHLSEVLKAAEPSLPAEGSSTQKKFPPHVSIAAIVGGMSAQKQRRVLDRGLDIIVATPGRLWDIMQDDDSLALEIRNLKFLVLDEADRMIEAGHFAELENILRLTLREASEEQIPGEEHENEADEEVKDGNEMQTFVFSATLSKDLQRNLKKPMRPKFSSKKKKQQKPASTLDDLLLRLDFRDADPEIIDLTPEGNLISSLQEGRINCLTSDKDVYLYYFFLRYPGRSLVFLSSIDGIRRLLPLLELLEVKAFPLHSQLEQRQRLKNLDRFKSIPNAVLLATDIAARGLDIPAVDHVIHFQIPRTADTYVHRNGRTARANRKGFSMLMCAPDERRVVKALMSSLGREESSIEELDIEMSMVDKLKARVQLARQIENSQHKVKKTNHDRNWMKEAAETLGVDLDSELDSDNEDNQANRSKKARDAKIRGMKEELKGMLKTPLIGRGVSAKFITSGTRPIISDLLAGELNEHLVGAKKTEAGSEMVKGASSGKKKSKRKAEPAASGKQNS